MRGALNFINRYTDISKKKIIIHVLVAGLSYAFILGMVNKAIGGDTISNEPRLFIMLLLQVALHLYSKKTYMNITSILSGEIIDKIRVDIIGKIRFSELRFIESVGKGEIYNRLTEETGNIYRTAPTFPMAGEGIVSFVAIFIYMMFISPIGAMLMVLLVVLGVIAYTLASIPAKRKLAASRSKEVELLEKLNDVLSGFKEIKINYKKNEDLFADYKAIAKEAEKLKSVAMTTFNDTFLLVNVSFLCLIGVIIFWLPLTDLIENEEVVSLVASLLFLWGPMMMAFAVMPQYFMVSVSIANIEELNALIDNFELDIPEKVPEAPDFESINLNSLEFRYAGKNGEVLFQLGPLDFSVKKGEVVFIVGGNGSGKSTLMTLLTGLYYPEQGTIDLDQRIVTRQDYSAYRELFSTIFTDFYIFKKLYGLDDIDANEVNDLLWKMGLEKKTEYVNKQFTHTNLSNGQRKRIAYISALLENKPIYVFDEWAADQDPEFRKIFYNRFIEDMRVMGKTVIAVSHDDRYFNTADRIIKMDEGKIVPAEEMKSVFE